jgi:hypothetical protein
VGRYRGRCTNFLWAAYPLIRMPNRGRSYEPIDHEDLGRLAEIARLDRENLFARKPRYRVLGERLICVALCQGAALHFSTARTV